MTYIYLLYCIVKDFDQVKRYVFDAVMMRRDAINILETRCLALRCLRNSNIEK